MAKAEPVLMYEKAEGTPTRGKPDETTLDHGFRQLPYDFPSYVRLTRLMDEVRPANPDDKEDRVVRGLKGHVMEVDLFTFGVKVYIRVTTDGELKVFAKDSEGTEVLGEWSK